MKAVLAALLLVAVLAGPDSLFAFVDGFQKGLENAEGCEKHPGQCGRGLGNVVKLIGEMQGFRKPSQLKDNTPAMDAQLFLSGLTTGLRLDNNTISACYSAFNQASYSLSLLYSDIMAIDTRFEVGKAIESTCLADGFLGISFSPCNFGGLWDDIVHIDFGKVIANFINSQNMCVITDGWTSIYTCSADFEGCGFGVGVTIRLLLGWGI